MANMVALRIAAVFALLPQLTENFFAINWLDAAALDVIVPAVKHFANLRQSGEAPSHGILDEIVRRAIGSGCKLQETRFGFWGESDYHIGQSRDVFRNVKDK